MSETAIDWILLRGLTRESRHWGNFPDRMAAALGARVLCLDLPGNGRLNAEPSLPTIEAMADWCHAEIAAKAMPGPCGVLAMSLGAMVAVAWSERHPADIKRAALLSTSLRPFSPFYHRLRPANYPSVLRSLLLPMTPEALESSILRATSRREGDATATLGEWLRWRRENPVSRRNTAIQLRAAARYRAPACASLRHMLLLAGAGDRLVNPECSRRLARAWQIPMALHAWAGHDLALDDPDWVLEVLGGWLATDASPAAMRVGSAS